MENKRLLASSNTKNVLKYPYMMRQSMKSYCTHKVPDAGNVNTQQPKGLRITKLVMSY